ncbi:hypothetical protein AGMMS49938_13550 [Fibrobacterales bacterium]|nr:hypothetical protein AGMMS49938_13550 [Fibrobacterales bacterium]
MENLLQTTQEYVRHLPKDKLQSAFDFVKFLYEQDMPLDDFDYELAKNADKSTDTATVSFDSALKKLGLKHADL